MRCGSCSSQMLTALRGLDCPNTGILGDEDSIGPNLQSLASRRVTEAMAKIGCPVLRSSAFNV